MVTQPIKACLMGIVLAVTVMVPVSVPAKPGTLAQSPLFLATQVKSNIFFVLDDSGSMDWEVLKSTGALAIGDYSGFPNSGNIDYTPTDSDRDEILESCAGYNVLYYDPNITYTPWYGVDQAGNVYGDQSITAARWDPYYPASTVDLTQADGGNDPPGYMTWSDDGDGIFEQGECPDPSDASYDYFNQFTATVSGYGHANVMTAEEQTNFANWFTYYRKREYVMKRAVSELMNDSSNRMGVATLHNNNSVTTPVKDMETGTNRNDLLDNLFRNYSSGGTPLRWALEEAGEYFHKDDGYSHNYMPSESSPILPEAEGGACQQNFSILMSDGYWNGGTPDRADNADGDNNTDWDGGAMADSYSDTLADVAMYYYENDLSSTLNNEVRIIEDVDENDAQHMVTFTVAFGVDGTLTSDPPNRTDAFAWPNPLDTQDEERIDDMRHAAFNARGEFLNAKDPQGLISSLNAAIAEIEARIGSASSVSFNSSELTQDTVIYQASFNSTRWSGDLEAKSLDPVTGAISSTANWSAADQLDAQASRVMLTYDGTDGVPFTWAEINDATNPITSALNDLKSDNAGGTVTDAEAEARLDFLRGDDSNEGTGYSFRRRTSRLGDIVHSSPVYVGAPALYWPDAAPFPDADGETYSDFEASSAASRQAVVYVGSNDGTLHGFNAETGDEVIAYVPSMLYSSATNEGLHYLTDANYQHRYYVDLDPTVSDVYINTSTGVGATPSWRTVLVGGLRAGGRGLYALDVTDPGVFSEASTYPEDIVLWEFSNSDDADLGHTFSRPTMALMNNGEWAVIIANGYNDTGDGQAKLFILFLEDGLDGWGVGDYVEINTEVGNTTERNGLSTPAVADLDGDGDADRVYAGDLEGNMWAFDISDSNSSKWDVAYSQGNTPKPLFTADTNQPITGKPALSKHLTQPDTANNEPNVMVYFGTGQYITDGDKTSTDTQSLYGVWDMGDKELTRGDLVMQEIDSSVSSSTTATANAVDYGGSDRGWYFDLPDTGERLITTPLLWAGNAYFNSLVPESDPCSSGATGILTALDMITGGLPEEPPLDMNGDGIINDEDLTENDQGEDDIVQNRKGDFGTGLADPKQLGDYLYPNVGDPTRIPPGESDKTGRLSWQELL